MRDIIGKPDCVMATYAIGHGDGTSYKNHFDFHSYSSVKRVKVHKY